tara:strand:- start:84 stop:221 length:138 start_codon:yes stop_codon:yes gene_type:complete
MNEFQAITLSSSLALLAITWFFFGFKDDDDDDFGQMRPIMQRINN